MKNRTFTRNELNSELEKRGIKHIVWSEKETLLEDLKRARENGGAVVSAARFDPTMSEALKTNCIVIFVIGRLRIKQANDKFKESMYGTVVFYFKRKKFGTKNIVGYEQI